MKSIEDGFPPAEDQNDAAKEGNLFNKLTETFKNDKQPSWPQLKEMEIQRRKILSEVSRFG